MPERFKTYAQAVTATSTMTFFSSATGTSVVNYVNIINVLTSGTASISLTMTRGTSTFLVTRNTALASSQSIAGVQRPLVLENGDGLRVQASPANSINILASVLEVS